jgi:type VI secretion system protein ImpA
MTTIDVAALLEPVSAEAPSGEAVEYDAPYIELETLARGVAREEDADGHVVREAEEPKWPEVARVALELCAKSKDLRVALYLTRAQLAVAGLPGLKDGLELIKGYVEQYWPSVHPQLDPEDDNDPSIRVNTLAALCDIGTVLRAVRAAPLTQSRQFGRASYRDFAIATGLMPAPAARDEDEKLPDSARIEAAFADTAAEALEATRRAVQGALEGLDGIDAALNEALAGSGGPDFEPLRALLREIAALLDHELAKRGGGEVATQEGDAGAAADGTAPAGAAARGAAGAIRSRADVSLLLDRICRYYADHEPSSPVPLILERAKRLVTMNFLDILKELTPDGVPQFGVVAGIKEEEEQGE